MADEEQLERLRRGVDIWNAWREEEPSIRPSLSQADLSGTNLREADLGGADLREANLRGTNLIRADLIAANLSETDLRKARCIAAHLVQASLRNADLRGANLSRADLRGADLCGANLRGANLIGANFVAALLSEADLSEARLGGADLSKASLVGANLNGANLRQANLIDARLDHADVTGAVLWETQRGGWSTKEVVCQRASWDREGEKLTEYGPGEFERIFGEKPQIVLRYAGGLSSIDLLALPLVVERLQAQHPDSVLQVRSLQNDAGGASVTITVEDHADRSPDVVRQELARIQTKLECVVDERDHLRRLLAPGIAQSLLKITEFLSLPRQEVHIYGSTGLTTIEGPSTLTGDTYNISGQAGAVGPGAHAHDNIFPQAQGSIDLPKLVEELGRLRVAMKGEATGTREEDKAIGAVADAQEAAAKGDGSAALQFLKGAGKWALEVAEKVAVEVAVEALKKVV